MSRPLRTASIVGARPQFVKLSPVSRAMQKSRVPIEDQIIHTGQHYDDAMSRVFFEELSIPSPAINLEIGSGLHGAQTARMLEAIEKVLLDSRPDVVVVYGDTNSTLAGALAAAKLHIPVAHVEAGLRSFNRQMPEELNRIATDHLSDSLFAPTLTAIENLQKEGLGARSSLTGDVMYDAVLHTAEIAERKSRILAQLGLQSGAFGVATLHRAENTHPAQLLVLLDALNAAATRIGRLVFPMHPRTGAAIAAGLVKWSPCPALSVVEPLGYLDMLCLLQHASVVLTDSGGLQKEAFFLGCPCVTLRNETEWVETLRDEANSIAGSDASRLTEALELALSRPVSSVAKGGVSGPFGDGRAAHSIVEAVCNLAEEKG